MSDIAGKPGETGADALCDTLLANDVDVCFANARYWTLGYSCSSSSSSSIGGALASLRWSRPLRPCLLLTKVVV